MSKIMFLADLHGNMPATLAIEKEIERIKPDDLWFLGDAVGKGPESDQTLDWVRNNCRHFIAGNWDLGCVEAYRTGVSGIKPDDSCCEKSEKDRREWLETLSFYCEQLGKERLEWLESLPQEDEILISGINFRLVHGRPIDINYHPYLTMDEFRPGFTDTKGKLHGGFISADCHMPYIREMDLGYAINTGSIGNSLGVTRCHALVIEGEPGASELSPISMNILSIPYDNKLAAEIADRYPLPNRDAYKKEIMTGVYSR
ncbi:MAG: metallophosphatase family protein [Saccharofermentans sp.]|nr:metallophosphatase family protein [Saccharofermentans sp.]